MSKIEEQVIQKIRGRAEHGRQKYGTTMERTDITPQGWVKHLQEELMDAAVYAERLAIEIAGFEGSGDAALAIELDRVREVLGRTASKPSVLIRQLRNRCERQQRAIQEARKILGASEGESLGDAATPFADVPLSGELTFEQARECARRHVLIEFRLCDGEWTDSSANYCDVEKAVRCIDRKLVYRIKEVRL